MNIIFIQPNWIEDLGRFSRLGKIRSPVPNIGIFYLAAIAERKGHKAEILDADPENLATNDIVSYILRNRYDIVGITATSPIFHRAVRIAELLKENKYNGKILIGGVHFDIFKKEAFRDCFDYGFFGESEYTFDRFLQIIENGSDNFDGMKGFVYRRDDKVIETEPAEIIKDLDALNFPAMHLLKLDNYIMTFAWHRPKKIMSILPTRGCPFKCVFCCEPSLHNIIRYRSPKNFVDEMEKWHKELGASHFWFIESNMTLRRDRIEGICHEILNRNLKITFEGSTRANLIDESLLQLMKSAGLIRISYGLENATPEILKIIRKEIKLEDVSKAVKLSYKLGIETNVTAMIGLPGETRETINRTVNFIRNIPEIMYSAVSIANPYPGTEMYEWAKTGKHGMHLMIDDLSQYTRYEFSPIRVNDLSQEDLVRLQKIALLKIHFTPRRILFAIKIMGFSSLVRIFTNFVIIFLKELRKGIINKWRENLRNTIRLLKTARLYARVGLAGITPKRAYVMLRYWILTVLFRRKIPWLIEFSITYRCQCRCKHCSVSNYFEEARTGKRIELTTDQIDAVLQQAVKMGIPKVDLFGGEPLIRKDVLDIIKLGACKGLYISITTNAVALTKETIRKLKKAGIACVHVSLDSPDMEEHDSGRGVPGLWQKAVDGIRNCHAEGVPCIASTFITRDRIKNFGAGETDDSHLKRIIDFTKELKASALRILFPIISGEWSDTTQIEFTEEEKSRVIENIDYSFAFIEGAYSVKNKRKVCQALHGKILNISPYGDIQLCSAFADTFGNIKDAPLVDLIRGMWNHPIYIKNKNGSCCNINKLRR